MRCISPSERAGRERRREIFSLLRAGLLTVGAAARVGWGAEECTNHATALPCPCQPPCLLSALGNQNKKTREASNHPHSVKHKQIKRGWRSRKCLLWGWSRKSRPLSPSASNFPILSSTLSQEFRDTISKPGRSVPQKTIARIQPLLSPLPHPSPVLHSVHSSATSLEW